jgi:hypothetical protein
MAVVLYWDYGFMFLSCSCSLGILGAADAQVREMETMCAVSFSPMVLCSVPTAAVLLLW